MKLLHPRGHADLSYLPDGRRRLSAVATDGAYVHRPACDTAYPPELLRLILDVKGPGWACDEIARDEDPSYIAPHTRATVLAHVPLESLAGKRLLDFGCGSGASTMILSRLLPDTEIVGVELEPKLLEIARGRAAFYGKDVGFLQSPSGDRLPEGLGMFDAIFLPAVYEHLLPHERKTVVPLLWRHLNPGGVLFIDETPWRWFPLESHTSGLPFVNYLPQALAFPFVRLLSPRGLRRDSWETLLRKGVRGASVREILRDIRGAEDGEPSVVPPRLGGMRTPVDVWVEGYARQASGAGGNTKRLLGRVLAFLYSVTRVAMVPYLSLAIRKAGR